MSTTSLESSLRATDVIGFLEQILRSSVEDLQKAKQQNLAPGDFAASSLESQLRQLYRLTVLVSKSEESMEKTAQLWEVMAGVCDAYNDELSSLGCETVHCRTVRDRMLDLRNRCNRIRDLHRKA